MRLTTEDARRRAEAADHGILATIHPDGTPDPVPACFVIVGDVLAVPIDTLKPKSSTDLQRRRNLTGNPRATFLVEQWDAADWSRLWWVRLRLEAWSVEEPTRARLETDLRTRYRQYASAPFAAILTFRILEISGWAASPPPG